MKRNPKALAAAKRRAEHEAIRKEQPMKAGIRREMAKVIRNAERRKGKHISTESNAPTFEPHRTREYIYANG